MRYLSMWPNSKTMGRELWSQFDDIFQSLAERNLPREMESFSPSLDIQEKPNEYVLKFDMPGIEKDQIKVEVRDNTLFVSGERKREEKEEGEFVRFERFYGKFERAITLPRNVDSEKINARYADGVLELVVPKSAGAATRQIEVKKS